MDSNVPDAAVALESGGAADAVEIYRVRLAVVLHQAQREGNLQVYQEDAYDHFLQRECILQVLLVYLYRPLPYIIDQADGDCLLQA